MVVEKKLELSGAVLTQERHDEVKLHLQSGIYPERITNGYHRGKFREKVKRGRFQVNDKPVEGGSTEPVLVVSNSGDDGAAAFTRAVVVGEVYDVQTMDHS